MDELGSAGWRNMVCVESANALGNGIILPKRKTYTHVATYSVKSLAALKEKMSLCLRE